MFAGARLTRVFLVLICAGCSPKKFGSVMEDGSKLCMQSGPSCDTEASFQTKSIEVPAGASAVDILFVIDNSASMAVELANLGSKFQNLSGALGNKDWQACLLTTDWDNEAAAPRTWFDGQYILNASTPAFAAVFENTMNDIINGEINGASNIEQGIRSAHAVFANWTDPKFKGCLRANSIKTVIFVSDEDELANGWAPGEPRLYDPTPANYPQALLDVIAQKHAGQAFSAHAITVQPDDAACLLAQRMESGAYVEAMGYPALRYNELVAATHGEAVSICESDYSAPLTKIGQRVVRSVEALDLPCGSGADVLNIEVQSTTSSARADKVDANRVLFVPALAAGEKATIRFRCK